MIDLQVAIAKVPRFGIAESGDTLEMIERPGGGFSVVLVDGQGSGRGAKTLSAMIAARALSQLMDGSRDGVVARAAHDYLYTYRMGQVSASLNILSVDLRSGSVLISRNNPAPFYVLDERGIVVHDEPSQPIGLYAATKPQITELPLRAPMAVVLFSDGLLKAGEAYGEDLALPNLLAGWMETRDLTELADQLLTRAIELDRGEPSDDMSVVVLAAHEARGGDAVRRMWLSVPLSPELPAPGRDDRAEQDGQGDGRDTV